MRPSGQIDPDAGVEPGRPGGAAEPDLVLAPEELGVSRETSDRLRRFVAVLVRWQAAVNLVGPSALPSIWTRHVADSLQLLSFAPDAKVWVDLGSGAGFPGLVIACALADRTDAVVHLVESNRKKAAFLREAARTSGAVAIVHHCRVEHFVDEWEGETDIVTARALAPLPKLLQLAAPLLGKGAQALFLKGQDVEAELTESAKCWSMDVAVKPSRSDPTGRVIQIYSARKLLDSTGS